MITEFMLQNLSLVVCWLGGYMLTLGVDYGKRLQLGLQPSFLMWGALTFVWPFILGYALSHPIIIIHNGEQK